MKFPSFLRFHIFKLSQIKLLFKNDVIFNSELLRIEVGDRDKKHSLVDFIQWNSVITITNRFLGQIGHFTTQINPVITNSGYNELKSDSYFIGSVL
jgi:hypothetical protein